MCRALLLLLEVQRISALPSLAQSRGQASALRWQQGGVACRGARVSGSCEHAPSGWVATGHGGGRLPVGKTLLTPLRACSLVLPGCCARPLLTHIEKAPGSRGQRRGLESAHETYYRGLTYRGESPAGQKNHLACSPVVAAWTRYPYGLAAAG